MNEDPKITVITSLFKAGEHIDLFLADITKQTIFHELDWHFIDAASPDGELEKILEFQKSFHNVRVSRETSRIGLYKAWNKGVKKAKANYISNLNVDDKLRYDYYEVMYEQLEANRDIDIIYSNILAAQNKNATFNDEYGSPQKAKLVTSRYCDIISVSHLSAVHCCPVWKKSLHCEVGLFDEGFTIAGDTEFWLRALTLGKKIRKINDFMALYYINPDGISTPSDFGGTSEKDELRMLEIESIHKRYEKEINKYALQNFDNYLNSQR